MDYPLVQNWTNKDSSINNKSINNNKKENIKEKVEYEIDKNIVNENVVDLFNEYLALRKKKKLSNSQTVINRLQNKLKPFDDDVKKQMLENAITSGWKDIYEIKGATKTSVYTEEQLRKWFEIIWENVPNTQGKTSAYGSFKKLLSGEMEINGVKVKLTLNEMDLAVQLFAEENRYKEMKFIKRADSFFSVDILDYVEKVRNQESE